MQGHPFTVRIPQVIWECLPERINQLGMESIASLIISEIVYDLAIGKPHYTTGDLARLPAKERDRIMEEVAAAFKAGETLGGSWLEHKVAQATQDAALETAPPMSKVGEKLRKRIAQRKA